MQNKPNLCRFSPKNEHLWKKQTQFKANSKPIFAQKRASVEKTKPISVPLAPFIVYNCHPPSSFRKKAGGLII
jgi:hypothetical protein